MKTSAGKTIHNEGPQKTHNNEVSDLEEYRDQYTMKNTVRESKIKNTSNLSTIAEEQNSGYQQKTNSDVSIKDNRYIEADTLYGDIIYPDAYNPQELSEEMNIPKNKKDHFDTLNTDKHYEYLDSKDLIMYQNKIKYGKYIKPADGMIATHKTYKKISEEAENQCSRNRKQKQKINGNEGLLDMVDYTQGRSAMSRPGEKSILKSLNKTRGVKRQDL